MIGNTQKPNTFIEYGTTVHVGENTPLWQVSNQHGLSSLNNNTYIKGGISYKKKVHSWKIESELNLAIATGGSSTFIIQQAYADIRYKWIGIWGGNRELITEYLNPLLSSGGLVWSSNARPIPQICVGILDYIHLTPGIQLKVKVSYGWFTDGKYQERNVGEVY